MQMDDPLPKSPQITFQISLAGYDPNHGDQDHLTKWITAPSRAALERFISKHKLTLDGGPVSVINGSDVVDGHGKYRAVTLAEGADCVIDDVGKIVEGVLGSTEVRTRSPRSDKGRPRRRKK